MTTKILYVCTYWGVRSQIASLLTNALNEPSVVSECAGFEAGKIGDLPRKIMRDRGLTLSAESPDTLFGYARKSSDYDYVITLCNQHTQENFAVLYKVVDLLFRDHAKIVHWNIADFMSIDASGAARERAANEIVDAIESKVHALVDELRTRSGASAG